MHQILKNLRDELTANINDLNQRITDERPLNVMTGVWNCPGLNKRDLTRLTTLAIARIDVVANFDEPKDIAQLEHNISALSFLRAQTSQYLTNGNAAGALPAYQLTIDAVLTALADLWPDLTAVDADEYAKDVRNAKNRIRALESRLNGLEPRTGSLDEMVTRIESAYAAADNLPTDLEDLTEAKEKIDTLLALAETASASTNTQSNLHKVEMEKTVTAGGLIAQAIEEQLVQSKGLVDQLKQLHRIGTSTVLAGAFNTRAADLNRSVYIWLSVLMIALAGAWFIGHERALILSELLRPSAVLTTTNTVAILVQSLLMIMGMGAPIWLGWVATKQIGQRFKLAEDYYYKASISNAYEGYRREAVDLDDDFRRQLFQSALGRLDEQPLRVMEIESHGSPIHEALSRPGFWSFMIQVFGRKDHPSLNPEKSPSNSALEKINTEATKE